MTVPHAAWLTLALLLLSCAHAPAVELPRVGPVTKREVWRAVKQPQITAELVQFGGPTPSCLLRVNGTGTPIDGHVFECQGKLAYRWMAWSFPLNGSRFAALLVAPDISQIVAPMPNGDFHAALDPAASAALDASALLAAHVAERENGVLAKLAEFDRPARLAEDEEMLARGRAAMKAACGAEVALDLDYTSVSNEALQALSLATGCASVAETLERLCVNRAAAEHVRAHIKRVRCVPRKDPGVSAARSTVAMRGDELLVTIEDDASWLRDDTLALLLPRGTRSATAPVPPRPWADGGLLRDRMMLASMLVCADAKGRTVALGPNSETVGLDLEAADRTRLYVGTRAALTEVVPAPDWRESELYGGRSVGFVDPRFPAAPDAPRFVSLVTADRGWSSCTITCGPRTVTVPAVDPESARALLLGAQVSPPTFTRRPHALLRDTAGVYYFVDTSTLPGREKDFRVFVGKRGQLKQLAMTNVLSDSAGQLFSTKSGELRLVLDVKLPSFWLAGNKKVELRAVPVDENLDVIFVELGVYAAERLGTPCDDF